MPNHDAHPEQQKRGFVGSRHIAIRLAPVLATVMLQSDALEVVDRWRPVVGVMSTVVFALTAGHTSVEVTHANGALQVKIFFVPPLRRKRTARA